MQRHRAGQVVPEVILIGSEERRHDRIHARGSTAKLRGGSPRRKSSHICV
jgi:hypothetical protein